jgi:hypothetical protein
MVRIKAVPPDPGYGKPLQQPINPVRDNRHDLRHVVSREAAISRLKV